MKSVFRIIAIVAAIVILLFGVLAAYLFFVFDPNDYRDRIASEVEKHTGRSLMIEGDIGLSVFPWIGVKLGRAELGNAEGFGDEPFARVEGVELSAKLMPLLRSEIEVDRVVLNGLELNLERKADGGTNWDDLAGGGEEAAAESAPRSPGEDAAGGIAAIVVSGVEVSDSRVHFKDAAAGAEYAVEGFDLKTGEVSPGKDFPIELGFDLALSEPQLEGRVDAQGVANFEPEARRFALDGLEVRFAGTGAALPSGHAEVQVTASALSADMKAGVAALEDLVLKAYGVEARASLTGKNITSAPEFAGTLETPQFDPRALFEALGIDVPETADANVLKRTGLTADLAATDSSVSLRNLVVELDDSRLTGELSVADLAAQALRFDLALDAINVDRYLPPQAREGASGGGESGGSGGQSAGGSAAGGAVAVLDPAVLRGLNVTGKVAIGELTVSGMKVSDISLGIDARGGVLKLEPLAAMLYGGRYSGAANFDGRNDTLALNTRNTLTGVQIESLLTDLQGEASKLAGRAEINAALSARGNDVDAIKRTLSGDAGFKFLDGAIKGINVAHYLRQAQARIKGEPAPEMNEANQTDFTAMSGTAKIANGVVQNNDLDLRSPLLRVGGEGSANLPQETIDYLVRASVVASLSGQGGKGLEQLKGVTVPIRISGSFADPKFALDIQSLMSETAKQQAQEKIDSVVEEKLGEKVSPELQEKIQKGLGGLLGR